MIINKGFIFFIGHLFPLMLMAQGSPGGVADDVFWVRADDLLSTTTSGTSIAQWNDLSGNVNHLSQPSATLQPVYSSFAAANYNPVVIFDGLDDVLEFTTTMGTGTSARSFFVAGRSQNSFEHEAYITLDPGTTSPSLYDRWSITSEIRLRHNFGNVNYPQSTNTAGDHEQVILSFQNPVNATPSDLTAYYNSTPMTPTVTAAGGTTLATQLDIGTSIPQVGKGCDGCTSLGYLEGSIGEMAFYERDLTANERMRIETYFAIKYGVTLSTNYLATNSDPIYDVSTYGNDIIGIGRDDAETLLQKQSRTVDNSTQIYLDALASFNADNAGTLSNDISYVVMGNDQQDWCVTPNALAEMPSLATISCTISSRIEREWKVTRTNLSENFSIDLTLPTCPSTPGFTAGNLFVLVDDDGNFSNGGTSCYFNGDGTGIVLSLSGSTVSISDLALVHIPNNSTRYLTLAFDVVSLPVEFAEFNAVCSEENQAKLSWTTLSEHNNAYFIVEKSRSGTDWEILKKVEDIGNTLATSHYEIIDEEPYSMGYYKLTQVDIDGTETILDYKALNCSTSEMHAYTNALKTEVYIGFGKPLEENVKVTIVDNLGRIVSEKIVELGVLHGTIDISNISSSGMYVLSVSTLLDETIIFSKKLIM